MRELYYNLVQLLEILEQLIIDKEELNNFITSLKDY